MRKIKLNKDTEISNELIIKLIESHKNERDRILKMKKYYRNENEILDREYKDSTKPQNKLAHNYAGYITNSYVGYFIGKSVAYKSDDITMMEQIQSVLDYNDEADNNTTVAMEQSICGYAYEIVYADEDSNIRFRCVPTEEIICVYENTIEEKMLFAIRYYEEVNILDEEKKLVAVEVYSKDNCIKYIKDDDKLTQAEPTAHYFGDVPIVDYENNINRLGDFETSISIINSYDKSRSDLANDLEYFTNAMLVVYGVTMKDEDNNTGLDFKNNRVLNFINADGKAEYLLKNINDTALENHKNRLNSDIHKFSGVLDVTDENFANNLSGVAMKYKLSAMENITGIKESKFRKGLLRRIELICNGLNIISVEAGTEMKYTNIKIVFTRNVPANETELVNMVKQLYGILSEDTLFSLLPFVESASSEKELKAKENEDNAFEYDNFGDGSINSVGSDTVEELENDNN